jgi:hypothetical protein
MNPQSNSTWPMWQEPSTKGILPPWAFEIRKAMKSPSMGKSLVHGRCSPASLDYKTGAGVLNSRAKSGLPNPFSQAEMASANEMRRPWSILDIHFSSFQLIGIYHYISPYKTHIKLQKFLSKRCTVFQSFIYFVVWISSRIFGDAKHWFIGKK